MRFTLGIILFVLGLMIPILTNNVYWNHYTGFDKRKAVLIFTGCCLLMVVGCNLMIHSVL